MIQSLRWNTIFNKIEEIDSRPALLLERNFHQGADPVDTWESSALLEKDLLWTPFFGEIVGSKLQG